jgi:methyl-accepting chemotaxis protein
MKVKTKLAGLSAIGITMMVMVGVFGYRGITTVASKTDDLTVAATMIRNQLEADMMHDALRGDVLASLLAQTEEERATVDADLTDHAQHFREMIHENQALPMENEVRAALAEVAPSLESYIKAAEKIIGTAKTDVAAAKVDMPAFSTAFAELEDRMEKLSDLMEKSSSIHRDEASAVTAMSRTQMIGTVIVALVAVLLATGVVVGSITKPVNRMVHSLKDIAQGEGDLTQRLDDSSKDELGELAGEFNAFMAKLQGIIGRIQSTAGELSSAAQRISGATDQISDDAQQQAASLEETSASLRQLTQTIKQNADNAVMASTIAGDSRNAADQGGHVVSSATDAMTEISSSSKKMADIITTIDEIAFQTNLLSLNAAVEAARAGEQGRGFAVVASEVRNLANRSGGAAKEIRELIQDSVSKVDNGSSLITESGKNLDGIMKSVNKVNDIISEIAMASREQAQNIEQVGIAVTTMENVTNRNNQQTEELAELARGLSSQAQDLAQLVGGFRVG